MSDLSLATAHAVRHGSVYLCTVIAYCLLCNSKLQPTANYTSTPYYHTSPTLLLISNNALPPYRYKLVAIPVAKGTGMVTLCGGSEILAPMWFPFNNLLL